MSVKYILNQAGVKMGLDPAQSGDRAVLLRFLNEASSELYDQADVDEALMEQMFKVDGDQQIALPTTVGPLRAMREYSTHVPWHLTNQRPRYNQFNWKDRWRSWRLKGTSALMFPVVNQSQMTVSVAAVETPPVVVSITGPNDNASSVSEQIVMTATTMLSVNSYNDITTVKKDRVNNYDVTVSDADGNALSIIPNNQLLVRYRLIDVSLYPWSNTDMNQADHFMEVLFKKALPWLQNDDDEYPAFGYDNIIVNKILQLWCEEQGNAQEAIGYDAKATRSLARKLEDASRGTEQEAALVENSHDTLLPRNRPLGPARYMGQIYY